MSITSAAMRHWVRIIALRTQPGCQEENFGAYNPGINRDRFLGVFLAFWRSIASGPCRIGIRCRVYGKDVPAEVVAPGLRLCETVERPGSPSVDQGALPHGMDGQGRLDRRGPCLSPDGRRLPLGWDQGWLIPVRWGLF